MSWELWLGVAATVIALVALAVALPVLARERRARRSHEESSPHPSRSEGRELVAFVVNPSKAGSDDLEQTVRSAFAEAALPEPLWLETTIEDPGVGQTREALERDADVVVAVGGDGTVRAVAEGLVGSGRTMGLIPLGTGNLLARNLDLPVADPVAALRVVIAGTDRTVDVGWFRVLEYAVPPEPEGPVGTPPDDRAAVEGPRYGGRVADPEADASDDRAGDDADGDATGGMPPDFATAEHDPGTAGALAKDTEKNHIFLVIAGLGFDAAMVADADDELKARVGWVAYFVAGIKHLHGRRMRAHIQLDDEPARDARLRSFLIGNCGRLPGGITLLPDALIDDGELDIAAVDTRGGLAGWAQLFGEVAMQRFGMRNELPAKIGRIDHTRAKRVHVRVEGGEQAQVDGDVLGPAVEIESWVDPGALVLRTAGTAGAAS